MPRGEGPLVQGKERAPRSRDQQRVRLHVLLPVSAVAGLLGIAAAVALFSLIGLFSNFFYYHRLALRYVEPHASPFAASPLTVAVVVCGALVAGLAIRYGDLALRGHGIPEVMEAVLQRGGRIPWRIAVLKPLTAALVIGTGSPFGAEGPIIQTAGALGSLVGQVVPLTDRERAILLGCGAAAGMTGIFATPLAAVLLALELLVFEFSAAAVVPIAAAAAVAAALRPHLLPPSPLFPSTAGFHGGPLAVLWTAALGVAAGLEAVALTRALYGLEDLFERIRWRPLVVRPVIGAVVVGCIALAFPQVLGMGYDLIRQVLAGGLPAGALLGILGAKAVGWLVALASGTVGGVLAPLFLIAGSSGALVGLALAHVTGQSPTLVALLFMAAVFAGSSRAVLTAAVFAAEVSGDFRALPVLLLATAVAAATAGALLPYDLMTGKLVRRGVRPPLGFFPREFATSAEPEPHGTKRGESLCRPGGAAVAQRNNSLDR